MYKHLCSEIPSFTDHDSYEGFFVYPSPTNERWDMVLKILYKNKEENMTYIKLDLYLFFRLNFNLFLKRFYLIHEKYAVSGERRSLLLHNTRMNEPNATMIEIEIAEVLMSQTDQIISYMYGHNDIFVTCSNLIPLYVLCERLKIEGYLQNSLLKEIGKYCDKHRCIRYLNMAELLNCEELVWSCGDSVLSNLDYISFFEWITIQVPSFLRLIHQAQQSKLEKYSNDIVCNLVVQYLSSIIAHNHENARDIFKIHLNENEISEVALKYAVSLLRMIDILFADTSLHWRYKSIKVKCSVCCVYCVHDLCVFLKIYQLSMDKLCAEFTPFDTELCSGLQGLSPITFSNILINALHLPPTAINLSLYHYKDYNHHSYFRDRRLHISFVFFFCVCF